MIHFKLFALIIMNIKLCDINVSTITMASINSGVTNMEYILLD